MLRLLESIINVNNVGGNVSSDFFLKNGGEFFNKQTCSRSIISIARRSIIFKSIPAA